jgi:hypothetical protein
MKTYFHKAIQAIDETQALKKKTWQSRPTTHITPPGWALALSRFRAALLDQEIRASGPQLVLSCQLVEQYFFTLDPVRRRGPARHVNG